MTDDPHVREPRQEPPLMPWTPMRFEWPEAGDSEVRRLRTEMPEEAKGLFLLVPPYGHGKVLVEAYYPDEIEDHYARDWLDRWRTADLAHGRLVAIKVHDDIKPSDEPLNQEHIRELCRNGRNLRGDLKRTARASYREDELDEINDTEESVVYDRFVEFWAEKVRETRKYALTPHVGPARGTNLGGVI